MNLYNEVIEELKDHKKTVKDIIFIACDNKLISVDEFMGYARNFDYDEGFGTNYVNPALIIVGDNWWLERHEYDGSEWFEFKTIPVKPTEKLENIDDVNYYYDK